MLTPAAHSLQTAILINVPLAVVLSLIAGALWRMRCPDRRTRTFASAAALLLSGLTLASYATPINLVPWAIVMLLGLAAAVTAALRAPRRLLLIEPLALPICLTGVVLVGLWF